MISLGDNKETPEEHYRGLDFSGLSFPSDGLSISTLRKLRPELFDKGFGDGEDAQPKFFFEGRYSEDVIANMLFCERLIATFAYADARRMDQPRYDLPVFKNELATLYVRYGIASGSHHAEQLIRDIERQGIALANQKQP